MRVAGLDLYGAIGGTAACRRLSTAFYTRVARDPVLRPFFPGKTMKCAIEEFAAFLVQFLGGPAEDSQRRWWLSLRESHLRFRIGPRERSAWLGLMAKALEEAQIEEPARTALLAFFEQSSAYVVNTENMVAGGGERQGRIDQEIARRWVAQRELDEAVAAVRCEDAERAIGLAESGSLPELFARDHGILAGLLEMMMTSRNQAMLRWVRDRIAGDPSLVREHYAGRTLLHAASACGSFALVELLLRVGADPNVADGGGHTALYSVANQCGTSEGASVVRILADAGADVNADDGVKRCTPLHMAARRGNARVAAALLDCGADIEARDSLGETPLRRAVNCNKPEVAALLIGRGANVHSVGSKGLTPLSAARTRAMKEVLRERRPSSII